MSQKQIKIRSAVRRDHAENYLLTSLVAFAVTVIITRVFLQLTGFPEVGNSVLHIAHALWGGLLLFIAVLLPLALANRWAIQASALLGGVGIGLFIDEVGKFITQTNDYFFPPSLSIVYGFFLLTVLVYLYFRWPHQENSRKAMYHVLEGLKDALDGDLDQKEAARIEAQLTIARSADRGEILSLADAVTSYLEREKDRLLAAEPGFWKRAAMWVDYLGRRLGRRRHRTLISVILILWLAFVVGFVLVLLQGNPNLDYQVAQWKIPLIIIQALIGVLMILALIAWLSGREKNGLNFAVAGFLLSLVALQTLYFYLSQFSALTTTLIQFVFLLILLAYRRWYFNGVYENTRS
jgi:hypothetical protein